MVTIVSCWFLTTIVRSERVLFFYDVILRRKLSALSLYINCFPVSFSSYSDHTGHFLCLPRDWFCHLQKENVCHFSRYVCLLLQVPVPLTLSFIHYLYITLLPLSSTALMEIIGRWNINRLCFPFWSFRTCLFKYVFRDRQLCHIVYSRNICAKRYLIHGSCTMRTCQARVTPSNRNKFNASTRPFQELIKDFMLTVGKTSVNFSEYH